MDSDTAAFNAASAQIAADIVAKMESAEAQATQVPAPVAAAVVPVAEVVAPAQPQADGTVAKLLAKLTDMEATISALKQGSTPVQQAPTPVDDYSDFAQDPLEAMQRRGIDAAWVARALTARVMGNEAPPELRAQVAMGGQLNQFQKMIGDLQGQVKALNSELGRRDYYTELDSYTPGPDNTPATAAMLKANPTWVKAQLRQVVKEDALERSKLPNAAPLTAAEVYTRLEQRIAPIYSTFAPAPSAPPPQIAPAATSSSPAPANTATPSVPPLSATLSGVPPQTVATSYEDKVAQIMDDVLRRHNIQ